MLKDIMIICVDLYEKYIDAKVKCSRQNKSFTHSRDKTPTVREVFAG